MPIGRSGASLRRVSNGSTPRTRTPNPRIWKRSLPSCRRASARKSPPPRKVRRSRRRTGVETPSPGGKRGRSEGEPLPEKRRARLTRYGAHVAAISCLNIAAPRRGSPGQSGPRRKRHNRQRRPFPQTCALSAHHPRPGQGQPDPACAGPPPNTTRPLHGRAPPPDGYHALESLVAFAGTGDTLTFAPGRTLDLAVEG